MKIHTTSRETAFQRAELLIVPVTPAAGDKTANGFARFSGRSRTALTELDKIFNGQISVKLKRSKYEPAQQKRLSLSLLSGAERKSPRALTLRLSGLAPTALERAASELNAWRKLGGDLARTSEAEGVATAAVILEEISSNDLPQVVGAIIEGIELGRYRFTRYKPAKEAQTLIELLLVTDAKLNVSTVASAARSLTVATNRARDIVNTAPSDFTPADLVREAKELARTLGRRATLRVYDTRSLERLGAGGLLGVSRGSDQPPFLVHLAWNAGQRVKGKRIVLIGKGVTFDSGGYSIKPAKSMEDMKCDMAGAACVLGALRALGSSIGTRAYPHEVHVLVPTCENMVNGSGMKPGDVLTIMNGKTVEVLNTDAEGRLILADALSFSARLKPDIIIDAATLTGAIVVSLGDDIAGLFSDDDDLAVRLLLAGNDSGERFWRMPIAQEYRQNIDGGVSELRNIAPSGGPGAIIATLFLKEFVPAGARWAHLDIAGPAHVSRSHDYFPGGGSGFGVATLTRFLMGFGG